MPPARVPRRLPVSHDGSVTTEEEGVMSQASRYYDESYAGGPAANYERYFVPAIGAPVARDLIEAAALTPGERVLDVACGTGVVTRLAAERVGTDGSVAGLDVNPGMLQVARSVTPPNLEISWYETGAEAMPLPDGAFDVVLCQMGLQFIADKLAALREMRRVLGPGGRLILNVPGPTPEPFALMEEALERQVSPEAGAFVHAVFSLYDAGELGELARRAGYDQVDVQIADKQLRLPPPREFLWQYAHATPLAQFVAQLGEERREALGREIAEAWKPFVRDGDTALTVRMATVSAVR
jgi:ubiquinone/menaquinone biosynthesis C-methylase UbiE